MTDARTTAVEPSHHHGFFRIHPTNDRIRPWALDDGTQNGWMANVAWVDVEPDIRIYIDKHERTPWLYGDAEVLKRPTAALMVTPPLLDRTCRLNPTILRNGTFGLAVITRRTMR